MDINIIRMPGIVFKADSFLKAAMYQATEDTFVVVIAIKESGGDFQVFKGTKDECEEYLDKIHKEMSGWTCQK